MGALGLVVMAIATLLFLAVAIAAVLIAMRYPGSGAAPPSRQAPVTPTDPPPSDARRRDRAKSADVQLLREHPELQRPRQPARAAAPVAATDHSGAPGREIPAAGSLVSPRQCYAASRYAGVRARARCDGSG
jgi:hypothetical protein